MTRSPIAAWTPLFGLGPADRGFDTNLRVDPCENGVWVAWKEKRYPGNLIDCSDGTCRVLLFTEQMLRAPPWSMEPLDHKPGLAIEVHGPDDSTYRYATVQEVVSFALRVRYADGSEGWTSARNMRRPAAE